MKRIERLIFRPLRLMIILTLLCLPVLFTQCKKDKLPVNGDPVKFTWLAEDYPPFNYLENGSAQGVSVDILEDLFTRLKLPIDRTAIEISDWASAYETTLSKPGNMLFSMVKTPERTNLFKWVGPIATHNEVVIFLKKSNVQIKEIANLNNYFTGVIEGYSSIEVLMNRGVLRPNIIVYKSVSELYRALMENFEVQCIAYSDAGHNLALQAFGYPKDDFATPYTIVSDELYYAFNKETADEMITDFQNQLNLLKSDRATDGSSTYEKILNRYSVIEHSTDGITDEMVISLVNKTAADIESNAAETFTKINAGLAPYRNASNSALYTFVYDTDVVMVANAGTPSSVGTSFAGKPDVAGKFFRDEIVQGALSNGSGWVNYIFTKPDLSGLTYKTTFYKKTTASNSKVYIVCAGKAN